MVHTYKDFDHNLRLTTDVVIVGSGCGGAVLAHKMSQEGYEVIVCEEGSHYTSEDYGRMKPTEAFRKLYRDYGGTTTMHPGNTPLILIQQGKMVGGSSPVNGAVSIRTPDWIIDHWRNDLGLTEFSHSEMNKACDEVERINHIVTMSPKLNSGSVKKIINVARKHKWEGGQIKRNVDKCDGANRCISGCPFDAKKSVLLTYLQEARDNGAQIIANLKVSKIHTKGDRATGVTGYIRHPISNRKICRIKIRAKLVIVAASALHTPGLLAASGLGKRSKQLGRNLSLHPAFRTYGTFDEKINGHKGAFQTYTIEEFRKKHIHLINVFPAPNLIAGTLPGIGHSHYRLMDQYTKLGIFGFMLSDSSRGRVFQVGGRPMAVYYMNDHDRAKAIEGLKIVARIWFEAGAKKVYLPFYANSELNSPDEIDKIRIGTWTKPKMWEVTSAHPMGTCKIGHDSKNSVLDPYHRLHELKNLYVTDSSAVPSSVAVNPQVTIMAMATRASRYILENRDWRLDRGE